MSQFMKSTSSLRILIHLFVSICFCSSAFTQLPPPPLPGGPQNDDFSGAIDLASSNYCSSNNTEFDNNGYSGDGIRPANWQYGPNANAWFKFQATTNSIDIDLIDGSSFDDSMLALFDANGVDVASTGYNGSGNRSVSFGGMVVGNWYYISVDTRSSSSTDTGWFGLCLNSYDTYDNFVGAKVIDANHCTGNNSEFNNDGYTPDGIRPSNWQYGPSANAWFKFQAVGSRTEINLNAGSGFDDAMLAVFDANQSQVASVGYNGSGNRSLTIIGLVAGQWYYIAVDTRTNATSDTGPFGLCLSSIVPLNTNDLIANAIELTTAHCLSGIFDNTGFGSELAKPTNWQSNGNADAWFKFQAQMGGVNFTINSQGMGLGRFAIYDANSQELTSKEGDPLIDPMSVTGISHSGLVVGQWYYLRVDTKIAGQEGAFDVCYSYFIPTNDDFVSAQTLSSTACSGNNNEFNNDGYTGDGARPSNWQYGPNTNAWFKFQATTNAIDITLSAGTSFDDAMLALLDVNQQELVSVGYNGSGNRSLSHLGLTSGQWYYVAVDNQSTSDAGYFGLCFNSYDVNDDISAAQILDANYCSPNNEDFNNDGFSGDGSRPSNWQYGPVANAWFKFQATTNAVSIDLEAGSSFDDSMLALFDNNQLELSSVGFDGAGNKSLLFVGLTAGQWYYVAVDNQSTADAGNFGLCLSPFDAYDTFGTAKTLISSSCSSTFNEFNTFGYSADGSKPSNWANGPTRNAWFKFQATTNGIDIIVDEGSGFEPMLALFNSSQTELSSDGYGVGSTAISYGGLTIGQWYYISVDKDSSFGSDGGEFGLCLSPFTSNDLFSGATILGSNACSGNNREFNNVGYSGDGAKPTNWQSGPNANALFKFQATHNSIEIDVDGYGSFDNTMIVVLDASQQEILSVGSNGNGDRTLKVDGGLVEGQWYFIAVDNRYSSNTGDFGLCLNSFNSNNNIIAATVISASHCTGSTLEFSNAGYSGDGTKPIDWDSGPHVNAWFKFQAVDPTIKIEFLRGSAGAGQLALHDSNQNEIASLGNISTSTPSLVFGELVVGGWYYINVDVKSGAGNGGTFGLCLTSSQTFDFKIYAAPITSIDNFCSSASAYTNVGASGDGPTPSNWDEQPINNVWFKFQAVSEDAKITLDPQTLEFGRIALFSSSGAEVASLDYDHGGTTNMYKFRDRTLEINNQLTSGQWYYISVDHKYSSSGSGTFGICIKGGSYDEPSTAKLITSDNYCSVADEFSNEANDGFGAQPTNWNIAPNANVWFKFQATKNSVKVTADLNLLAIYDQNLNELHSSSFGAISYSNLTVGQDYYVAVDGALSGTNTPTMGSFGLCLEQQNSNGHKSNAITISNAENYCSGPTEYSTEFASFDGFVPSNWPILSEEGRNIWFKFQATKNTVEITSTASWLALTDDQNIDLMSSSSSPMGFANLQVGSWYYVNIGTGFLSPDFSLCIDQYNGGDHKADPIIITDVNDFCTNTLSNKYATPDEISASHWSEGPYQNVWFKFQAVETGLKVGFKELDPNTLNYADARMALYDLSNNEMEIAKVSSSQDTLNYWYTTLVVGDWYLLNVDENMPNFNTNEFRMCFESFQSNDLKANAETLNLVNGDYCSDLAGLSNELATTGETNWQNTSAGSVWYKFQAVADGMTLELERGSSNGTANNMKMALIEANGNVLKQKEHHTSYHDILMSQTGLTIGDWYYIVVDSYQEGTFTLCVNSFDSNDDYQDAIVLDEQASFCDNFNSPSSTADGPLTHLGSSGNVWFKVQAQSSTIKLDVQRTSAPSLFSKIALLDENLNLISDNTTSTRKDLLYMGLTEGDWYYISVEAGSVNYDYTLCYEFLGYNDTPVSAIEISHLPYQYETNYGGNDPRSQFTLLGATPDGARPSNWTEGPNRNVWFKFVAPQNTASITLYPSSGNALQYPMLAIFDQSLNELASFAQNNSSTPGLGDLTYSGLVAGQTYYISVDNRASNSSSTLFTFSLLSCQSGTYEPGIITPSDNYTCNGNSPARILSSSDATYDGSVSYRWFKSVEGEDGTFEDVGSSAIDSFYDPAPQTQTTWYKRRSRASKYCGDQYQYSNVVKIEVLRDEATFANQTICPGEVASPFEIITPIQGTVSSYIWERSSTSSSGFSVIENSNIVSITPEVGYWYRRQSTYSIGCVSDYSNVVSLSVTPLTAGSISSSINVCPGESFSIATESLAAADVAISYLWEKSVTSSTTGFSTISGNEASSASIQQTESTAWYRRVASIGGCEVRTAVSTVNLQSFPTTIAADKTVLIDGTPATLTVGETCANSFIWKKDGIQISTAPSIQVYQTGTYSLTIEGESTSIEITSSRIFWSANNGNWDDLATWKLAADGQSGLAVPESSDKVKIKGHKVTLQGTKHCSTLLVKSGNTYTSSLLIEGDLTVKGAVKIRKQPNSSNIPKIKVAYGGNLRVIEN